MTEDAAAAALRRLHHLAKTRAFGGAVGSGELIEAGLDALLSDVEAPSLAQLAGLGVPAPAGPPEWAMARWIAEQMLDGSVEPADGANRIWLQCATGSQPLELLDPMVDVATGLAVSAEEDDAEQFARYEARALPAARVLLAGGPAPGQGASAGGEFVDGGVVGGE